VQLLASGEGLLTVILVVIHCNDLTVTVLKMYKAVAVLSALMKVCRFLVITGVTLMLCWFYRAARILCTFRKVCLASHMQQHLVVRCCMPGCDELYIAMSHACMQRAVRRTFGTGPLVVLVVLDYSCQNVTTLCVATEPCLLRVTWGD